MSELEMNWRVDWLEAIEEIKRLKSRYCAHCDDQDNPMASRACSSRTVFGKASVWPLYRARSDPNGSAEIVFAAHLLMNPIIEVLDADHATGRWRLVMSASVRVDGKNEARWLVAGYTDRYLRVDGVWLFQRMATHVNFYEPHTGSWANSAVD